MKTGILGTGSSYPSTVISNDDLSKVMDTSDEWICTRTGIKERRISKGESAVQLAAGAARAALKNAGTDAKEIQLIIVATSSPDYLFPNAASLVQTEIGAVNAAGYDLSAACSGFIFAMNTAHAFIKSGIYHKILVIGTEVMSRELDWNDRSTCVLFGDGAGAAVIGQAEEGIEEIVMHSDGSRGMVLTSGYRDVKNFLIESETDSNMEGSRNQKKKYVTMDGQEVFKFAVKQVPEAIQELLSNSGVSIDDVNYFVLHQANVRIIQSVAKRLKIDMEKFPVNLDRFGNTSAASVPIMLDEMNRSGMLKKGDKIVLSGFGAGLTWGATLLTWN